MTFKISYLLNSKLKDPEIKFWSKFKRQQLQSFNYMPTSYKREEGYLSKRERRKESVGIACYAIALSLSSFCQSFNILIVLAMVCTLQSKV
jgi:hypothetical protein